ncbi:MAG: hypothetical protein LBC61_01500 [Candidatus Peribacteria bacterium]|nr:hypothetical protein [Candidatus Peribacteria bacterium]
MFKNKSETIIFVQLSFETWVIFSLSQKDIFTQLQKFSFIDLLSITKFETEEIEEIASHLNQNVITLYKSSKLLIFEVECFSHIIFKSSFSIQIPSSETTIFLIHHSSISIIIFVAPASKEFSTNSFTTETGLSTTSHADI